VNFDHDELMRTYLTESEEQLCQIEEALVQLEAEPDNLEVTESLLRTVHTLKGNASTVGFSNVAEFAHGLEDVLQRINSKKMAITAEVVSLFLLAVDALREVVAEAAAGDEEIGPPQKEALRRVTEYSPVEVFEKRKPEEHLLKANQDIQNDERRRSPERRREEIQTPYQQTKTLRVGTEKLDQMLNLTGEIAIAHGRLRQNLEKKNGEIADEIVEAHRTVNTLFMQLQEEIMQVRMIPVGPTFRQYIRMVRDLAQTLGKVVRLVLEGEDVEVDMTVIELLRDPLTHMLRNAIDHGIEPAHVRKEAGKDPCGLITLRAFHDSGNIVIQMEDDGAGLNRSKILEKALAKGFVSTLQTLSDDEVYRLIFKAGFSTTDAVTELSGRGVGMDVVRRNIEALRGTVDIQNREEAGVVFTIRLPLTLAIIEGFEVGVGEETYVIPLESVVECLELPASDRGQSKGSGVVYLRGKALPYFHLRNLFHLAGTAVERESIVVVQHESGQAGIVVDVLYGENQTVIKSLGKVFHHLTGVSGSTILGNGRVALILDIKTLLRDAVERATESAESLR
jgi:two-component system chemotaxis sensor kinase CheA